MQSSLDEPELDKALNEILLDKESSINWSNNIKVNDSVCSIRKFVLTLMLCFDDRMHESFLPDLIGKLEQNKLSFSLQHKDLIFHIQRLNLTSEKTLRL